LTAVMKLYSSWRRCKSLFNMLRNQDNALRLSIDLSHAPVVGTSRAAGEG
jgi:hypothetical protein